LSSAVGYLRRKKRNEKGVEKHNGKQGARLVNCIYKSFLKKKSKEDGFVTHRNGTESWDPWCTTSLGTPWAMNCSESLSGNWDRHDEDEAHFSSFCQSNGYGKKNIPTEENEHKNSQAQSGSIR
jgi:hypothetical protein